MLIDPALGLGYIFDVKEYTALPVLDKQSLLFSESREIGVAWPVDVDLGEYPVDLPYVESLVLRRQLCNGLEVKELRTKIILYHSQY
jgi:hypothetical protein